MVRGMVFDGLGRVWGQFVMFWARFLTDSGWISVVLDALEAQGADFFIRVRPISAFWMLPLRLSVHISSIWEVAGVLLGVLGGRFGFELESKIEMSTRISEIQESMLSPAWEHDFPMVC